MLKMIMIVVDAEDDAHDHDRDAVRNADADADDMPESSKSQTSEDGFATMKFILGVCHSHID